MSEPHKITSPDPGPVQYVERAVFTVVDEDGVVHTARTLEKPIYAGYGDVDYEDIDVTDCDFECNTYWKRDVRAAVTCLECLGRA